ncbi:hypothetical protein DFJ58DRAFT_846071 [Suillus subalutaceus]|uniref:uncharacterized protein n=1 Tax=Suillus subalutaceus TaxID=48586 RepID=UPI001B873566|nr:uncharacterized protein DFJ58DRAFT_846071 [Suillus subalutaceus]KAG1838463.1 hypothetical protein DFJ58DRAFT_846071 [Suillus subalutaceus]
MVSTPVTYHGAPVLYEFQLPVLDSQPEFQVQQEVQTEPTLPTPAMKQAMPKHNALAESFLRSIQANFICPIAGDILPRGACGLCPICRSNSSVPGNCPFIYLRGTQDAAVSLMEGIAREFRDVSEEDKDSQDEELRSYARGTIWDHWKVRSRVGLAVLHDIRQVRREVDFVDVGRVVSWARAQLAASAQPAASAQLPSTVGASAQLPIHIYNRPIAKLPAKVKPPSLVQQSLTIHASTILINNAGIDRVLEPKGLHTHIITSHLHARYRKCLVDLEFVGDDDPTPLTLCPASMITSDPMPLSGLIVDNFVICVALVPPLLEGQQVIVDADASSPWSPDEYGIVLLP